METGRADLPPPAEDEHPWVELEPAFDWADLILPEAALEQLRAVPAVLNRRRRNGRKPSDEKPPGTRLLFAGGAGTGKTLATRILAAELGLGILQVDLLSVFGEDNVEAKQTVERVFAAAERSGAIVCFENGDELARDRPRNARSNTRRAAVEVARLVERSERYPGVVIFASRLKQRHAALLDRFDDVVDFPFPESDARKEIWRTLLPSDAQVTETHLGFLASSFKLAGGTIASCVERARASAQAQGGAVQMFHLSRALQDEYRDRAMSESTREALEELLSTTASAALGQREAGALAKGEPEAVAHDEPQALTHDEPEAVAHDEPQALTHDEPEAVAHDEPQAPAHDEPEAPARHEPDVALGATAAEAERVRRQPVTPQAVPVRRWSALLAIVGVVMAALLGFLIAHGSSGGSQPPPLDKHASAGVLRVSFPSGWQLQSPPTTPKLGLADELALAPAAPAGRVLLIGTTQATGRPVLPASLLATLPDSPTPQIVTLGGVRFYRYLNLPASGERMSVYELPTTVGTILGACVTGSGSASFTSSCERVLATIRLASGSVLALAPPATYASSLDAVLSKLNAVRASAGARLRAGRGTQAQASAANALAAAHDQAASALLALHAGSASTANAALAAALRATGGAYGALARAATKRDAAGYRAATATLARATSALNAAFAQLAKLGYRVG